MKEGIKVILIKARSTEDIRPYENATITAKASKGRRKIAKFIIDMDDYNYTEILDIASKCKHIVQVNYIGSDELLATLQIPQNLYVTKTYDLVDMNNITEIQNFLSTVPNGITPVLRIPEQHKDNEVLMRWSYGISTLYPNIRVVGGNFFYIEGARVGYIGKDMLEALGDKDTPNYEYSDYCFEVYTLDDVEITIGAIKEPKIPKAKATSTKSSKPTTSKESKGTKPTAKGGKYASLLNLKGNL